MRTTHPPRRIRLLRLTAALGAVFAGAGALAVWLALRPAPVYRPGEGVAGITAGLARTLPPDHPQVVFTDVTRESGIAFRHFSGTRTSWLPEDMGSGAAWGDFDNDGWIDLFIVNVVGPLSLTEAERRRSPARSALYRNNGDGTFSDVTDRAGIDHRTWGMAAAWGDYDHDGWLDLVVTAYGENVLYRNNGDGTFSDRTAEAGLGHRPGFWTGASWADYDRDGFLDLYVTGYVRFARGPGDDRLQDDAENPASINPSSFPPERNLLYRNNGDGTFTEVAEAAGVPDSAGKGLAAVWTDFDGDGWPDLYVANDVSDNAFFRNLGNGSFTDVSHAARVADYRGAMGVAVGDWDNDGDQDMFVTHWIAQENALYNNRTSQLRAAGQANPPLQFMDQADRYGLGQIALDFIGWGTAFFDYDNDGRLDLFVVNGSTFQQRDAPTRIVPMRDQMFWNRDLQEGFYDVSAVSGPYFSHAYVGRGAAVADYDNDGDMDVFIVNHDGPGILLRNDGGNRSPWLQVELRGRTGNRQGIGAVLRLVAGGTVQTRQVGVQPSYLSQNSPIEHFGLGAGVRMVDTLEIDWPGGKRQTRTAIPVNRRMLIDESERREQVLDFWSRYRAATRDRIAGRVEAAAAGYAEALELNPGHEDALYYLGNARLDLGDFSGAQRAWQRLAAVNPAGSRAHSRLGSLSLCLARDAPFDLAAAAAAFRRAHEINREETGPLLHLAEVSLFTGELDAARRYVDAVLGSHATSASGHFYAGYLAWKTGDSAAAQASFARAVAAATPGGPADGLSGEGDTKAGAPMLSGRGRCGELRELSVPFPRPPAADLGPEMTRRYVTLDSLLVAGRRRSG